MFFKIVFLRKVKIRKFKETLIQRRFPVDVAKFLRTAYFMGNLWWLLLVINRLKAEKQRRNNRHTFLSFTGLKLHVEIQIH